MAPRSRPASGVTKLLLTDHISFSLASDVFMHLRSVGVQPLNIAFPWFQQAFVGVLHVQQVLQLWDRIIGFNSVDILAFMAASIFIFRGAALKKAKNADMVR